MALKELIDWLLEGGEAFVEHRTRLDLLGQPQDNPEVLERQVHAWVRMASLAGLGIFPKETAKSLAYFFGFAGTATAFIISKNIIGTQQLNTHLIFT